MIVVAAILSTLADVLAAVFFSWPPIVISCVLGAINHLNINREASVSVRAAIVAVTLIVFLCATPAWPFSIGAIGGMRPIGITAEGIWLDLLPFLALKAVAFVCATAVSVGSRLVGKRDRATGASA
jgi:hypothetical protein